MLILTNFRSTNVCFYQNILVLYLWKHGNVWLHNLNHTVYTFFLWYCLFRYLNPSLVLWGFSRTSCGFLSLAKSILCLPLNSSQWIIASVWWVCWPETFSFDSNFYRTETLPTMSLGHWQMHFWLTMSSLSWFLQSLSIIVRLPMELKG